MHSNLPAPGTTLRGYYQKNGTDHNSQYLGPLIVAKGGNNPTPVRFKVTNELPDGPLWLPEDKTLMGAQFDDGLNPVVDRPQNRISVHLHGGATPWISDGTPHQWFTPHVLGDPYHNLPDYNVNRGVSYQSVPDMPAPGAGKYTFYYTNQQSGRLLFSMTTTWGPPTTTSMPAWLRATSSTMTPRTP